MFQKNQKSLFYISLAVGSRLSRFKKVNNLNYPMEGRISIHTWLTNSESNILVAVLIVVKSRNASIEIHIDILACTYIDLITPTVF